MIKCNITIGFSNEMEETDQELYDMKGLGDQSLSPPGRWLCQFEFGLQHDTGTLLDLILIIVSQYQLQCQNT